MNTTIGTQEAYETAKAALEAAREAAKTDPELRDAAKAAWHALQIAAIAYLGKPKGMRRSSRAGRMQAAQARVKA